jgi:hypothetical protein
MLSAQHCWSPDILGEASILKLVPLLEAQYHISADVPVLRLLEKLLQLLVGVQTLWFGHQANQRVQASGPVDPHHKYLRAHLRRPSNEA